MAHIEIETQAGEAGFVDEGAQVSGGAHFAGGIFDAQSYAAMMSVQDEMFESAEGGVALAGVGLFARAAHVQDHARVRQVFGDVDGALELVHGLDAAHALDFADGKRERAFAGGAEIAAVGGVEGFEREPMRVQGLGHGLDFGARGVIEMAAGTEEFQAFETGGGNLAEKFGSDFAGNERVGREKSAHKLSWRIIF